MKKVETFEGWVNGVKFNDKDAMDNYAKSLNEPISQYVITKSIKFVDDEEVEDTPKENQVAELPEVPAPYKTIESYVVPTIDEIEATADIVVNNPSKMANVDKNLTARMDFYVNKIEEITDYEVGMKIDEDIHKAAEITCKHCEDKANELQNACEGINKQIEALTHKLTEINALSEYYSSIAGYAGAMSDLTTVE